MATQRVTRPRDSTTLAKLSVCVVLALCSQPSVVRADDYTGMDLVQDCQSPNGNRLLFCMGYLRGMLSGMMAGQQSFQLGYLLCQPAGVSPPQLSLMVQKFAREQPSLLNQDALNLAFRPILEAFRCKLGQKPNYGRLGP